MKLAISGFCGKMGQRICAIAQTDKRCKVVLGLERLDHPEIGNKNGIEITSDPVSLKKCDCLIEFTTPEATIKHLEYLVKFKKAAIIGTTGLSAGDTKKIKSAAKKIPIVYSPNMSAGVNLLFKLLREAASVLQGYDVSVSEAHHVHKKDAPSGTAKKIVDIIDAQGVAVKYEDVTVVREGEIVGDHKIVFESDVDRIELFHSAKTRDIFAKGAVMAAKWVAGKKPGLYSMNDVLGIED
jgi:4-hydroxy-tetrahydrodipicolinate reductase